MDAIRGFFPPDLPVIGHSLLIASRRNAIHIYEGFCARNRYQGQVLTSHICGMSLLAPALDICYWHNTPDILYIPRNMHTVFALLCFVVVIHWLIFPCPSGLFHWHCGNLTIAPVPAKQPWWLWINTSFEFIMNDYITTTKQSTSKPCAYFLGYTIYMNKPAEHKSNYWCISFVLFLQPPHISFITV